MRIVAFLVHAGLFQCTSSFQFPIVTRQSSTISRFSAISSDRIPSPNPESVEFPPPLSPVDRLKRGATFWSTAVPIIASYYGLISRIKLQELVLDNPMTEDEIENLWDAQHQDGAKKLAETITELKGFYVKTAQIISSRQGKFSSSSSSSAGSDNAYAGDFDLSLIIVTIFFSGYRSVSQTIHRSTFRFHRQPGSHAC